MQDYTLKGTLVLLLDREETWEHGENLKRENMGEDEKVYMWKN